jgi:septal ring factor EnvC (AmiA/AmiB activator)
MASVRPKSNWAQIVQASIQIAAVMVAAATYWIMIVPQQQLNVAKEDLAKAQKDLKGVNDDLLAKKRQIADALQTIQTVSQDLKKQQQALADYTAKTRLFVVDQFALSVATAASSHASNHGDHAKDFILF